MKMQADKHKRELFFEVGDWVYLTLKPYRQHTVAKRRNEKLAPRFFGPFRVLETIGHVVYRLQLPETSRIHNVFHVSQLRKAIGDRTSTPSLPATLTKDMKVLLQSGQVEGVREGVAGKEVLIRWKDLSEYEAT